MKWAAALLVVTALSFFIFPGHTYLQQDTQIYVPILENQWSGALAGDLIVARPHVNFTLYDELANALRWVTKASLRNVLEAEQFVFRGLGLFGIFLIALALGLSPEGAFVVTAIWALGAAIPGSAVLTIEYEPTPRSFAVPLLLLAAGLALRGRWWWAGITAGAAFLLHAPTTWPFLLVLLCLAAVRRRAALSFIPLAIAAAMLLWIGFSQSVAEPQHFFERIPPQQEALQRMRAAYNYVSTWWTGWMGQYLLFAGVALAALWRVRATLESWILLGGLVFAGLLSVPVSYLLLEDAKLTVIPQVQPARALLFVTGTALLASAVAGVRAANRKQWMEAVCWFAFALFVPAQVQFFAWPSLRVALIVLTLSLLLALATQDRPRVLIALLLAPAMAFAAGVVTHRDIETPQLEELAAWARTRTESSAVFAFPEAGRNRSPGWFRSEALRTVYVDWKGGGQVNYLRDFSEEWWRRWQLVMVHSPAPTEYRKLGVDYLVVPHPLRSKRSPVFRNTNWYVYRLTDLDRSS